MDNNIETEEWRDIEGYEGLYEVSSLGRVRGCDRYVSNGRGSVLLCKGKVLKLKKDKLGYHRIILSKDNKQTTFQVHRLVAKAFQDVCGKLRSGLEVDHLDTDPSNNRATNLRWCTCSENHLNPLTRKHRSDAMKGENHPRYGKFGKDNPTSKPIIQMDRQGNLLTEFEGLMDAERQLGIDPSSISRCCKGKVKTAGGFKWKYKTA